MKAKEKKCIECKEVKSIDEFYPKKGSSRGYSFCKTCQQKKSKEYNRTKDGIITQFYSNQKTGSKTRGHKPPTYTKQELKDWVFSQKLFHELYDNWKASGYDKKMKPSCDRTDDYQGYSLSRLQLMTWDENRIKGHRDIKNGINNKRSRAIVGKSKTTGREIEFYSMRQAARTTGVDFRNITSCCSGKAKSAGGYYWKYKEDDGVVVQQQEYNMN